MNTATCQICSQSVPLDDSGRLETHDHPDYYQIPSGHCYDRARLHVFIGTNKSCPGSGTTPQAPDGAENVEPDDHILWRDVCLLFGFDPSDSEGITHLEALALITGKFETMKAEHAKALSDLKSRLAMAEDAAEKGNKARELAGAMEACIQEQDEKIAGLEKALQEIVDGADAPDIDVGGEMKFGLHCGVEDRNCRDRYEGANYGWASGVERTLEWAANVAKSALDAARDKKG